MKKPLRTAMVFQGGGALGAYECGVVLELYRARGWPQHNKPAVITGLSIGAVNAAILAGAKNGDPIETIERVWLEDFSLLTPMMPSIQVASEIIPQSIQQQLSTLGNAGMYRLRDEYMYMPFFAPYITDSIYTTLPLRRTLEHEVDFSKLNNDETQVVVTATNVRSGKLVRFGNTTSINALSKRKHPLDNHDRMQVEHILASGSLPPGFPMTVIDGEHYWDGGILSNTPLSEAINCLESCDGGSQEVERELIFVELCPPQGKVPRSIQDVMGRFLDLIFASKMDLDKKLFEKINSYIDLADDLKLLMDAINADPELKERVNHALAAKNETVNVDHIRSHAGLEELLGHTKIDAYTMIPYPSDPALANGTDFSKATIAARIDAGVQEARRQHLEQPNYLKAINVS